MPLIWKRIGSLRKNAVTIGTGSKVNHVYWRLAELNKTSPVLYVQVSLDRWCRFNSHCIRNMFLLCKGRKVNISVPYGSCQRDAQERIIHKNSLGCHKERINLFISFVKVCGLCSGTSCMVSLSQMTLPLGRRSTAFWPRRFLYHLEDLLLLSCRLLQQGHCTLLSCIGGWDDVPKEI